IFPVDDTLRCRDIIGEARERLLDDAHVVSVFCQDVINSAPCRTIGESAMHEYDVLDRARRRRRSINRCAGSDHYRCEGNAQRVCQSHCASRRYGSSRAMEPVSSRDFRLEMIFGQPPETAAMNFEGSRSIVWVMESLTAVPLGSSSIVQRDSPSAVTSGMCWFCQRITRRRGGSASTISPASRIRPSPDTCFHEGPGVHWLSQ